MSLDQVIAKIPKSVLLILVLGVALIFMVFDNPLKDECDIKTKIFLNEMRGITGSVKIKTKTQFAQINNWRDRCRDGNSIGACKDYFYGLRKMTAALKVFPEQCLPKFSDNNEWFLKVTAQAVLTLTMIAWSEKPPSGVADRMGWLTEAEVRTFCILKKTYASLAGDESLNDLKNSVYEQYPDAWPDTVNLDLRTPENRPKAFKTLKNTAGSLDRNQIYERSLFSIRCDLYQ